MKTEYLVHHGILGMHWGQRKEQNTKSSSRGKNFIYKMNHMSSKDKKKAKIVAGLTAGAIAITGAQFVTSVFAASIPGVGIPLSMASAFGGNAALKYIEKNATIKLSEL